MADLATPWRDDTVTIPCPACGAQFTPAGRQNFCSHACRQAAYRQRHPPPVPTIELPPPQQRRGVTVYACPSCDSRYLGQQRCPECNIFCRRVGIGGCCPSCDEPIAAQELTDP